MPGTGRLGPRERTGAWEALRGGEVDVLVVGGGITGAGVALDAATRGLRTALVEARDLASGTSSRSSKLFHGGLRYLEQLDFALVREALRERELMLTRLAPHLVKPVSFQLPLRHRVWERPYLGAGLTLYDTMGGARSVPRHRHLTRTWTRARWPDLRQDFIGSIVYHDAQADDARTTLTVARTAAAHGAVVRTRTEVTDLTKEDGRITGAVLRDVDSGETCSVRAGVVINATGVWTEDIQRLAGPGPRVRASKGVHIVVPGDRIRGVGGLVLRTEKSVLFVIPWGRRWIIGTTDTDYDADLANPLATSQDVDYLLDLVNGALERPLSRSDVLGVYAGLRPLVAGDDADTTKLSREHVVAVPAPGLVTVAGGKFTTYRIMARDTVDTAAAELGRTLPQSVTDRVPLLGADGYPALVNQLALLADGYGLPVSRMRRLLGRYGSLVHEVLADIDPSLREPAPGASDYLLAELRYGASHEGAVHLDDVLERRTRVSFEEAHRGTAAAPSAAAMISEVLDWDDAQITAEVETYTARMATEQSEAGLPPIPVHGGSVALS